MSPDRAVRLAALRTAERVARDRLTAASDVSWRAHDAWRTCHEAQAAQAAKVARKAAFDAHAAAHTALAAAEA